MPSSLFRTQEKEKDYKSLVLAEIKKPKIIRLENPHYIGSL
jgi:hypothetical protein